MGDVMPEVVHYHVLDALGRRRVLAAVELLE